MTRKSEFDVRIFEEAAKRFRKHYRDQNPPPDKPTLAAFWQNKLVWLLSIVFIAGGWLSAIRTKAVFAAISEHEIEGWLAIIVIEGVAGGLALFQVLEDYKRSGHVPESHKVGIFIKWIVGLAIGIGLISNVYSILIAQHQQYATLDWIVFILTGSIATLTLAIIGHTIGVLYVLSREDIQDDLNSYRQDVQAWESEFNEQWSQASVQKQWVRMVQNALEGKQASEQIEPRSMNTVNTSSGAGFARLAHVQNERPEQRSMNTVNNSRLNKTEQIAGILATIDDLNDWSYSQLLQREDIAQLTSSRGTLNNAMNLLKNESEATNE